VVSARLARKLNVRFGADNLADEDFRFTQGGHPQRRYGLGRTFTLNFGFAAF
jgi:outer membrane receptor protein involved in Fe transport